MTLVKVNNRPFGNLFNDFLNEIPGAARSFGQDFLLFHRQIFMKHRMPITWN